MKDAQNQTSNLLAYYNQPYVKVVSQIIGYLAELSIVVLNIPQIILICRKKSGKNVSTTMIFFNIGSGILFLTYGILIFQWPMIIGNSLYLIISCIMMVAKFLFKNTKK